MSRSRQTPPVTCRFATARAVISVPSTVIERFVLWCVGPTLVNRTDSSPEREFGYRHIRRVRAVVRQPRWDRRMSADGATAVAHVQPAVDETRYRRVPLDRLGAVGPATSRATRRLRALDVSCSVAGRSIAVGGQPAQRPALVLGGAARSAAMSGRRFGERRQAVRSLAAQVSASRAKVLPSGSCNHAMRPPPALGVIPLVSWTRPS